MFKLRVNLSSVIFLIFLELVVCRGAGQNSRPNLSRFFICAGLKGAGESVRS